MATTGDLFLIGWFLLFVWPLYCLSLLYYLFCHCIDCPSPIICLAIVLTMAKQIIEEGQTIPWPNK
jgi:hypothetical protein